MISIFVYWKSGGSPLPWNLDITLYVLPLLLLANIINNTSKLKSIVKNNPLFFLVIIVIGNSLLGGINYYLVGKKVDLYYGDVDIILLSFPAALCGIIFVILFSWIKYWKPLRYLGRNSLLIFAWHLIVYNWLGRFYDWLGLFQMPLSIGLILIRDSISFILILSILIPINEVIIRSKLKFIIGR